MASDGIVGRGVLLDIPRLRGVPWLEPGDHVTADDLIRAEEAQQVRVGQGDLLFVRVGHRRRRTELGPWDSAASRAGLHPTAVEFVAERRVAVLGSDSNNDTSPSAAEGVEFPVHVLAINAMGVHLLDWLQFDGLARLCEEAGRWSFCCVIAPLRLVRGNRVPRSTRLRSCDPRLRPRLLRRPGRRRPRRRGLDEFLAADPPAEHMVAPGLVGEHEREQDHGHDRHHPERVPADAVLCTVRLKAGLVLETITFGYRSMKIVSTQAAIVTVVAANAQPSLRVKASQTAAITASTAANSTGLSRAPLPAIAWVQDTKASTRAPVTGAIRAGQPAGPLAQVAGGLQGQERRAVQQADRRRT